VRTLHAAGTSESLLGELVADLMAQDNPTLGISAKRAQYELRIGARANSRAEAEALADATEAIIRARAGQYLVGAEPLVQLVTRELHERGLALALYEGNTRAPVYHALTATEPGRTSLHGAIIHPLDRPADDAAVASLARTGALAARDRWRTALALGVQPASAPGPDGFTLVALALAHDGGVIEAGRRYDLNLADGWEFIGTLALDLLRQYMLAG
jgi:hypothetical protein